MKRSVADPWLEDSGSGLSGSTGKKKAVRKLGNVVIPDGMDLTSSDGRRVASALEGGGAERGEQLGGAADGGGEEEGVRHVPATDEHVGAPDWTKHMTPEEVFAEFDTDGSGGIEWDEFRKMLPRLGIHIPTAKMRKYFTMIDVDGSGAIDIDEFKQTLFALDPDSGNPVGFRPNQILGPKDAFILFDKDNSGELDEDEFVWVLEYMGYELDLEDEGVVEELFKKYDTDKSGLIEYDEFRHAWLDLCDVRAELAARGTTRVSDDTPRWRLAQMLEELILEEERKEEEALRWAKVWVEHEKLMRQRRRAIRRAKDRSDRELQRAINAAGAVIMFGFGLRGQFRSEPTLPPMYGAARVRRLWMEMVRPSGVEVVAAPSDVGMGVGGAEKERREGGMKGGGSGSGSGSGVGVGGRRRKRGEWEKGLKMSTKKDSTLHLRSGRPESRGELRRSRTALRAKGDYRRGDLRGMKRFAATDMHSLVREQEEERDRKVREVHATYRSEMRLIAIDEGVIEDENDPIHDAKLANLLRANRSVQFSELLRETRAKLRMVVRPGAEIPTLDGETKKRASTSRKSQRGDTAGTIASFVKHDEAGLTSEVSKAAADGGLEEFVKEQLDEDALSDASSASVASIGPEEAEALGISQRDYARMRAREEAGKDSVLQGRKLKRSRFAGVDVNPCTLALWGRGAQYARVGGELAMVVDHRGHIFAWGGVEHHSDVAPKADVYGAVQSTPEWISLTDHAAAATAHTRLDVAESAGMLTERSSLLRAGARMLMPSASAWGPVEPHAPSRAVAVRTRKGGLGVMRVTSDAPPGVALVERGFDDPRDPRDAGPPSVRFPPTGTVALPDATRALPNPREVLSRGGEATDPSLGEVGISLARAAEEAVRESTPRTKRYGVEWYPEGALTSTPGYDRSIARATGREITMPPLPLLKDRASPHSATSHSIPSIHPASPYRGGLWGEPSLAWLEHLKRVRIAAKGKELKSSKFLAPTKQPVPMMRHPSKEEMFGPRLGPGKGTSANLLALRSRQGGEVVGLEDVRPGSLDTMARALSRGDSRSTHSTRRLSRRQERMLRHSRPTSEATSLTSPGRPPSTPHTPHTPHSAKHRHRAALPPHSPLTSAMPTIGDGDDGFAGDGGDGEVKRDGEVVAPRLEVPDIATVIASVDRMASSSHRGTDAKGFEKMILEGIRYGSQDSGVAGFRRVATYFGLWIAPRQPSPEEQLAFCLHVVLPRLNDEFMRESMRVRGFDPTNLNKRELVEKLSEIYRVEEGAIGAGGQKQVRISENAVRELRRQGMFQESDRHRDKILRIWQPLRKRLEDVTRVKEEADRLRRDVEEMRKEREYVAMRLAYEASRRDTRVRVSRDRRHIDIDFEPVTARGRATDRAAHPEEMVEDTSVPEEDLEGGMRAEGLEAGALGGREALRQAVREAVEPRRSLLRFAARAKQAQWVTDVALGEHHGLLVHGKDGRLYAWGSGSAGRLGLGKGDSGAGVGRGDAPLPTLVEGVRPFSIAQVAAGFAHSLCLTSDGRVFSFGNGTAGKLGLGEITSEFECYAASPVPIPFPPTAVRRSVRILQVSCGSNHSAAVSEEGHLFVWGSGDNGRLGLPPKPAYSTRSGVPQVGNVVTPTVVSDFLERDERVVQVACGGSHTLALTAIHDVREGRGEHKVLVARGGEVYAAGNGMATGTHGHKFEKMKGLEASPVIQVSAGFLHSAAVTAKGELYTWGSNRGHCCGLPISSHSNVLISKPTLVSSLYEADHNLCLSKLAHAEQSSIFRGAGPQRALDGDTDGFGEPNVILTQREACPWWQVDLGRQCTISQLLVWNREDAPRDEARPRDEYTSRLFPCWLMVSRDPFPPGRGPMSMDASLRTSILKKHIPKGGRCIVWDLPGETVARYVRVQSDRLTFFNFAQVQVMGIPSVHRAPTPVINVACGHHTTIAVLRRVTSRIELDKRYRAAVAADPSNADILRQFDAYFQSWDRYGRGENPIPSERINPSIQFRKVLDHLRAPLPPGPLGRTRRLNSIADVLLHEKPTPPPPPSPKTDATDRVRSKRPPTTSPPSSSKRSKSKSKSRSKSRSKSKRAEYLASKREEKREREGGIVEESEEEESEGEEESGEEESGEEESGEEESAEEESAEEESGDGESGEEESSSEEEEEEEEAGKGRGGLLSRVSSILMSSRSLLGSRGKRK